MSAPLPSSAPLRAIVAEHRRANFLHEVHLNAFRLQCVSCERERPFGQAHCVVCSRKRGKR